MNSINEEIIRHLLKSETSTSNQITILNHEIKKSVFEDRTISSSSEVCQLTVTYAENGETCEKLYFLKTPSNITEYEHIRPFRLYEKEIRMYESIFPRFRALLPEECFAPEHYYAGVNKTLILKDIRQSGYETRSTSEQLDFEHSVSVLRQLAKIHAVSVKVDQTAPEILDEVRENKILAEGTMISKEHRSLFEKKAEIVLNRGNFYFASESPNIFPHFRHQLLSRALDETKMKPDSFNVLIHGDLWTNNIMFKYNAYGDVENVNFIDFQTSWWTSPAVDILYFFTTSVRYEIFEKYFDLLLNIYLDTLNKVLKYLKCDRVYDIEHLYRDVESKYNFWIYTMVFFTPSMVTDPEKGHVGLDDLSVLEEEPYFKLSKNWMLYFIRKGAIPKILEDTTIAVNT